MNDKLTPEIAALIAGLIELADSAEHYELEGYEERFCRDGAATLESLAHENQLLKGVDEERANFPKLLREIMDARHYGNNDNQAANRMFAIANRIAVKMTTEAKAREALGVK